MLGKLAPHAAIYNRNHAEFHSFARKRDARGVFETIFRGHQWNVTGGAWAFIALFSVAAQYKGKVQHRGSGARHE